MEIKVHPITAEMRKERRLDVDLIVENGTFPIIYEDEDTWLLNMITAIFITKDSMYWGEQ